MAPATKSFVSVKPEEHQRQISDFFFLTPLLLRLLLHTASQTQPCCKPNLFLPALTAASPEAASESRSPEANI